MQYTANTLENHWMPFTSNRDFKDDPRLMVKAKGMHYWNHHGDKLIDASSGLFCSAAGHGRIEITDSRPASEVRMSLHMLAPMEGRNAVEFLLKPEGNGEATRVSWAIQGPMPYISKVLSLVCDMDAMIGKEFENGLAELKTIAER